MARLKVPYLSARRNADGTVRFYWQPSHELRQLGWKLRRLPDEEGAAVRMARALNLELVAWRKGTAPAGAPAPLPTVQPGTIAALVRGYKASRRYLSLAPVTRADYAKQLAKIEAWGGAYRAEAITSGHVGDFYEALCARSHTQANGVLRVFRVLLTYGQQQLALPVNAARQVQITGVPPRLRIWTPAEIDAVVAAADALGRPSIGDAILIAADTAQRQNDVLALPLIAASEKLRLRQSKRRAMVSIDLTPRLATRLAAAIARRPADATDPALILSETTGRRYKPDDFRHQFAEARALAIAGDAERGLAPCPGMAGATFQDFRDTALTRLAVAGCTIPEIAAVSGHSERSIAAILKHYLALGDEMAAHAIAKLLAHEAAKEESQA